jgi:hypothetical protein
VERLKKHVEDCVPNHHMRAAISDAITEITRLREALEKIAKGGAYRNPGHVCDYRAECQSHHTIATEALEGER